MSKSLTSGSGVTINYPSFNGAIAASGAVTMQGNINVTDAEFSGACTYTGDVAVSNQTVTATVSTVSNSGDVISSGGVVCSGDVAVQGDINVTDPTFSGACTYTGDVAVSNQTVSATVGTVSNSGDVISSGGVTCSGAVSVTVAQVQSDYTEEDTGVLSYIKHKPTLIKKENSTNNTLINFNDGTDDIEKIRISDSLISTTIPLTATRLETDGIIRSSTSAGDLTIQRGATPKITLAPTKVTILSLLEVDSIIQSKVVEAPVGGGTTTSNLELRRGGEGHIILSPDLTTFKEQATFEENVMIRSGLGINTSGTSPNAVVEIGNDTAASTFGSVGTGSRTHFKYNYSDLASNGNGIGNVGLYALTDIVTKSFFVSSSGTLSTSDDTYKSEEIELQNATETLCKITAKNYWKHTDYKVDAEDESPIPEKDASGNFITKIWESGVIAQQIEQVEELEHLVYTTPIGEGERALGVNYTQFIPFLIKSNQELHARIVELEKTITGPSLASY